MKASLGECILQDNKILLENVKNDPAFLSFAPIYKTTFEKTHLKRSRLKRIASDWLFVSILYFYSFVLFLFNPILNHCTILGALRTGRLGNTTCVSPSVFSVNCFQHLCVATGRMWAPFQIQMRLISPRSGRQHCAFVI